MIFNCLKIIIFNVSTIYKSYCLAWNILPDYFLLSILLPVLFTARKEKHPFYDSYSMRTSLFISFMHKHTFLTHSGAQESKCKCHLTNDLKLTVILSTFLKPQHGLRSGRLFNKEKKKKHFLAMRRQSLRRIDLPVCSFSILKKGESKQASTLRYGVLGNRVKLFLL